MIAWCYTIPVQLPDHGRKAKARWFPAGPKIAFTGGTNPFHVFRLVWEKIPGSFAVSGGAVAFIHSQTADYIVHFIAVATTATPFASPSSPIHSLSARTHAPSLSLAHSHLTHTHLTHRPIPERGYITLTTMATGDPSTELEPPPLSLKSQVWKYFGFPVSYVDKKATVCKLCRN